jgi:prepilin-type processing-associated H-X9-DG protein
VRLLSFLEQEALADDARRSGSFYLPIVGPASGGPHQGLRTVLPVFGCPADPRVRSTYDYYGLEVAITSYLGVQGTNRAKLDGILFVDSRVRIADITDGTSYTLAVGERPAYPQALWGVWYTGLFGGPTGTGAVVLGVREPCNPPFPVPLCCTNEVFRFGPGSVNDPQAAYHFWSLHMGGGHFLFADGSARFLSYSAEPTLPALSTRAGGETVDIP